MERIAAGNMRPVAVLGATGYVGGRLVPELLKKGHRVRALVRSPEKLRCRSFSHADLLEIRKANALDDSDLSLALEGCSEAFYLVRSTTSKSTEARTEDIQVARNMIKAANDAGLSRIICLGPQSGRDGCKDISHRDFPVEPGEILKSGPVPVTWLRTSIIIGSGSASFEIIRYLVERMPIMIAPRWLRSKIRPVAVRDVLSCLTACLETKETVGLTLDLVGPEELTVQDLFNIYAEEAGLPGRVAIPVGLSAPGIGAYWINLVTPVPASRALSFVESLCDSHTVEDKTLRNLLSLELTPPREAIRRALQRVEQHQVETCWSDAGDLKPPEWLQCGDADWTGGNILECNYKVLLDCPREEVWNVLRTMGGATGWFFSDALWRARGFIDRLVGGVGTSRGRRSRHEIRTGDALDFWRVLVAEENERLTLLAEMKLPGEAILHFSLWPRGKGCELKQTARFLPKGLLGLAYWHAMAPFHHYLFKGMLRRIAERSGCSLNREPEEFFGAHEVCRLPDDWD